MHLIFWASIVSEMCSKVELVQNSSNPQRLPRDQTTQIQLKFKNPEQNSTQERLPLSVGSFTPSSPVMESVARN